MALVRKTPFRKGYSPQANTNIDMDYQDYEELENQTPGEAENLKKATSPMKYAQWKPNAQTTSGAVRKSPDQLINYDWLQPNALPNIRRQINERWRKIPQDKEKQASLDLGVYLDPFDFPYEEMEAMPYNYNESIARGEEFINNADEEKLRAVIDFLDTYGY